MHNHVKWTTSSTATLARCLTPIFYYPQHNRFKNNNKRNEIIKILTAEQRRLGEYWRRREARSIASGGILLWKIWRIKV